MDEKQHERRQVRLPIGLAVVSAHRFLRWRRALRAHPTAGEVHGSTSAVLRGRGAANTFEALENPKSDESPRIPI